MLGRDDIQTFGMVMVSVKQDVLHEKNRNLGDGKTIVIPLA